MTPSALAVAKALEALPEVCPGVRTWVVAYSGGRDSTALLHATRAFAAQRGDAVRAVHVNHGFSLRPGTSNNTAWQFAASGEFRWSRCNERQIRPPD